MSNADPDKQFVDKTQKGSPGITYQILGTTLQGLSVQLDKGEVIYSEAGRMSWMTDNVDMTTHGQGCSQMISRIFSGESMFVNKFTCENDTGVVTFTTDQAGKVIPIELDENKPAVVFQRGAYLCSEEGIKRSIEFTKRIGAGLFGGKGFILQKVEGKGRAHLVADGEVASYELKEGQEIRVDQGNLVAYEDTVDFDIRTVSGPMNWLFGGEGIFLASLTGPGKVWLQTRKNTLTSAAVSQAAMRGGRGGGYNLSNPIGCIIGIMSTLLVIGLIVLGIVVGD